MHKALITSLIFISLLGCQTTNKIIVAESIRADHDFVATGKQYAIATQGQYASLAAGKMFQQKGNIIDAAVAASFAIAVERPQSTGIGGGGFMIFRQKDGSSYAIDFRERAPLKSSKNMYVINGKGDTTLSQKGILAVATPGIVAGLLEIHSKFGTLPLKTVMSPAIDLAQNGFPIYPSLSKALTARAEDLKRDPASKKIFLDQDGNPWPQGHTLVQKDLAATLRSISEHGSNEFYKGKTSQKIIRFIKSQKGLITEEDLRRYQVKWRKPLTSSFHEYEIIAMPPPSSGGVHVIQFLKFLEKDNLRKKGVLSTESIHLAAASLQSAFADRAKYLGDPDFVKIPTEQLISNQYIQERHKAVPIHKARTADQVSAGHPTGYESPETTHLSIMDAEGNAVSTTQTINGWFGSGVVVPETGIVLNNEMDDFSIQPGVPNLFGAIGGEANSIEPQKTPLSSMSPTLITKEGKSIMSVGAPGGTRIISCVAQTILNYLEFGLSLEDSISLIRYHHQWKPDVLSIDPPGPGASQVNDLQKMGYHVEIKTNNCFVMAVTNKNGELTSVADPRDIGRAIAQ